VWARSLGVHHYWAGYYDASVLTGPNLVGYIIVDDVPWERFGCWKQILGAQEEFVMTDKYMKKVRVRNWGKPAIFLCNEDNDPMVKATPIEKEWLKANCVFVKLMGKLY